MTPAPPGETAGAAVPRPGNRLTSGVLHGRRQGRPLRARQMSLMERLLPDLTVRPGALADPGACFAGTVASLRLEIGFGSGEHLIAQAVRHPDVGFIGCEPFRNGVASLLHQIDAAGVGNIRLHPGDAGEIVDALAAGSLARVDLLYPDPWPKRRQRKRRFVSEAMLARLARVLRPGGEFRFATDIDDYAGWTLRHMLASPDFSWRAHRADDWRVPWPDWVTTRYEGKARREGRPSCYLSFVRR